MPDSNDGVTLLIDMDGVLADFDRQFYDLCDRLNFTMHDGAVNCDNPCAEHRFATDCLLKKRERDIAYRMVCNTDWFRHLPVVTGAVEGMNALLEHPLVDDVFICTKPMERNKTVRDDKAAWLEEHFGKEWLYRLIISPDKGMVRGEVLLDDAPKSVWFDRAEWSPVIFPTPWNGPESPFAAREGVEDNLRWDWTMDIETLVGHALQVKEGR